MILITGATGHLGKAVVGSLLQKVSPDSIAVLVRDAAKAAALAEQGVEVRVGNYDDKASLVKAFTGVQKLYLVSGNDVLHRTAQQRNAVEAAVEAGVLHIVYTSFQHKKEVDSPLGLLAQSHLDTEKAIVASGLNYTILRHTLYMDVLPLFIGHDVLDKGAIWLPAGDGKVAFASRSDMAEAGAAVLLGDGHYNRIYDFTGPVAYGMQDVANALEKISGKAISYQSPASEAFKEVLTNAGLPAEAVSVTTGFAEAIRIGEMDKPDETLTGLLNHAPESLEQFLKKVYAPKA